ncbi:MAG: hypothetical protein J6J36_08425 [Clostridia bacterium]|nr:hypothetical protein [Clostridia bacterium]
MFSKSGYNNNLKELIKAKKADASVVNTIKENLEIQISAKNKIKKNEREIKKLNATNEDKMIIKTQTPIYNFRAYMNVTMEIMGIKKQIKQRSNEVKEFNKKIEEAELNNSKLEEEIDNQFKIYQENEIYVKAVKKLNKNSVSKESYAAYEKHIDNYENSIYSLEKKSTLPKPNAEDFVVILSVLKNDDEIKEEPKQTVKKTATKTTVKKSKKEPEQAEKKTAAKTTAKKSKKELNQAERKTAAKTTAKKSKKELEQAEKKAEAKTTTKKSKEESKQAEKKTEAKTTVKKIEKEPKQEVKRKAAKTATKKSN